MLQHVGGLPEFCASLISFLDMSLLSICFVFLLVSCVQPSLLLHMALFVIVFETKYWALVLSSDGFFVLFGLLHWCGSIVMDIHVVTLAGVVVQCIFCLCVCLLLFNFFCLFSFCAY